MERNHFWIFLGLGLAVGACLELMKGPATAPVRLAGFTRFETLLEEGKEVHVVEPLLEKFIPKKIVRRDQEEAVLPQQIAAADAPQAAVDPTAVKPAEKPLTPEELEKKKKEEEEKKKKALAKKKKEKLKRKKLEEEAEKQRLEALEAEKKKEEDDKKDDDKKEEVAANPGPQGAAAAPAPLINSNDPKSIPEWEAYLMKDVDHERMAKFVRLYQTGVVKSEVFYPVISSMLQDSRPKIRALAVSGLGSTPSAESFKVLLTVSTTDSDRSIRNAADTQVDSYARRENLRFLLAVITSQDNQAATIEAIHLVKQSASSSVKSAAVSAQSTQNPSVAAQTVARAYAPYMTALTQISQRSHDAQIRAAATQAVAEMNSLFTTLSDPQPVTTTASAPTI